MGSLSNDPGKPPDGHVPFDEIKGMTDEESTYLRNTCGITHAMWLNGIEGGILEISRFNRG